MFSQVPMSDDIQRVFNWYTRDRGVFRLKWGISNSLAWHTRLSIHGSLSGERSHFLPQILYSDNSPNSPRCFLPLSSMTWSALLYHWSRQLRLGTVLPRRFQSPPPHTCWHCEVDSVSPHLLPQHPEHTLAMALATLQKWPVCVATCPTADQSLLRKKSDEAHPKCLHVCYGLLK